MVQGSDGCSGIYTVQVSVPDYMSIDVNATDPTPGLSDGAFTLDVSGGTPSYEYSIDDQVTWVSTNTFSNLGAGVYLAYTKDANSCVQVTSVKLGQSTADVIELESDLSVYPNPSNGKVIVEGIALESVVVSNLNGQVLDVPMISLTNGWLADLTEMSSGIYVLTIKLNSTVRKVKVLKN